MGFDAVYLNTDQVKKFCPIINTSPNIRYPVLEVRYKKERVQLVMMQLLGVMQEVQMKWVLI